MTLRLPHPLVLMLGGVAVAAALTWIVPAGEFARRDDARTGRRIVVAGTYREVARTPVGPFAAVVAIPRGLAEAADVVAVVLFVGGAWVVVDKLGTLSRLVGALAGIFGRRTLAAVPVVGLFFASMGALENMQEEIIPLVPVLLALGRRLGFDAVTVVAMSAGAAMVGSAFGPTNPFQAGIAMQLAELPPFSGGVVRLAMFTAGFLLWTAWTLRHARRTSVVPEADAAGQQTMSARDLLILAFMLVPMALYVYGAIAFGWGFNELAAGFIVGAVAAGLAGGLGVERTMAVYLEGMQSLLAAAVLIGVARAISLVLAEGRVIDTILQAFSAPLVDVPAAWSALLMIPFHAAVHVVVPSVSGHAVLTMPLLVPLSDLIGVSRQAAVVAYQTGAGLTEIVTPTNGALMAILLAAGVSYQQWIRFAVIGVAAVALVGLLGVAAIQ